MMITIFVARQELVALMFFACMQFDRYPSSELNVRSFAQF